MFKKQDSAFWWALDNYVKDNPKYKNLTIDQKDLIEKAFDLAYYGLFQYQLYRGVELVDIDTTSFESIAKYIVDNYDRLAQFMKLKNRPVLDLHDEDNKQLFFETLEHVIIPYINDHSFGTIEHCTPSSETIGMMKMQLALKNQYDINYVSKNYPDKLYYSQVYPFLLTVLVLDPINPDRIYDNAKNFFNIEDITDAYQDGRLMSKEENEYLFSSIDRLKNPEDFESLLHEFSKERWELLDLNQRFRVVFQLSKFTAILLKDGIESITYLEDGDLIYDSLKNYLPIILESPEELKSYQILNKDNELVKKTFLYPMSFKDFDTKTLDKYFETLNIKNIKYHYNKLTAFRLGVIYSLSRLHVINDLGQESKKLRDFLIKRDKIALCNSLKIFDKEDTDLKTLCSYDFNYENGFLDQTTLNSILKNGKVTKAKEDFVDEKIKPIARILSYLLALDPSIVKTMDYSFEKLVKYYLICFGPYKKTKIGYEKSTANKLATILEKFAKKYTKSNSKDDDYYETFYLIDRLVNFKRKKHN